MLSVASITQGSGTATFNFGGGTLQASGAFSTTLPMTLTGSGGNATVNTNGYAVTFSGNLSGLAGPIKTGSNVLTLSGTNTYGGGTIVCGGAGRHNHRGPSRLRLRRHGVGRRGSRPWAFAWEDRASGAKATSTP